MRNIKVRLLVFCLSVMIGLALVSCSPSTASLPTPEQATPSAAVSAASPTPEPTATSLPGKVLLVTAAGTDAQAVEAALAELSEAAGLTLETRQGLQKEEVTPEIRVVVSLDAALNLAEMAAAVPQTQFIAVSAVDLPNSANLSVIRRRSEQQAFVAGFISVLLSTDYRAGGLLPVDGPLGASLQEVFKNGAQYYCGVCAPGYPLNVYYPVVAALPGTSDGPAWQTEAAGMFDNQKVEVYYLSAEAARLEVIAYLQGKIQVDKAVLVVGEQAAPEDLKEQWAVTVRFDVVSVLRQIWPDVVAGKGGTVLDAALIAENPNTELMGEGRMRLVKELIAEIQAGRVVLFTVPRE